MKTLIYTVLLFSNFVFVPQLFAESASVQSNLIVSNEYAPNLPNVVVAAPASGLLAEIEAIVSQGRYLHQELPRILSDKGKYIMMDSAGDGVGTILQNMPIGEGIQQLTKPQTEKTAFSTKIIAELQKIQQSDPKATIISIEQADGSDSLYCKSWKKKNNPISQQATMHMLIHFLAENLQAKDASNTARDLKAQSIEDISMSCFGTDDTIYDAVVQLSSGNTVNISQTNVTIKDNWHSHPGLSLIQLQLNKNPADPFGQKGEQEVFLDIHIEGEAVSTVIVDGK